MNGRLFKYMRIRVLFPRRSLQGCPKRSLVGAFSFSLSFFLQACGDSYAEESSLRLLVEASKGPDKGGGSAVASQKGDGMLFLSFRFRRGFTFELKLDVRLSQREEYK